MLIYEHIGQSIIKMVYRIEISSFFIYFAMQESVKFRLSNVTNEFFVYKWCIYIVPSIYCRPFLRRAARMTSSSSTEGARDFSRSTWESISLCFPIHHTVIFKESLFPRWILMSMETLTYLRTRWRVFWGSCSYSIALKKKQKRGLSPVTKVCVASKEWPNHCARDWQMLWIPGQHIGQTNRKRVHRIEFSSWRVA